VRMHNASPNRRNPRARFKSHRVAFGSPDTTSRTGHRTPLASRHAPHQVPALNPLQQTLHDRYVRPATLSWSPIQRRTHVIRAIRNRQRSPSPCDARSANVERVASTPDRRSARGRGHIAFAWRQLRTCYLCTGRRDERPPHHNNSNVFTSTALSRSRRRPPKSGWLPRTWRVRPMKGTPCSR
jgi:hypothetical protein